MFWNDQNTYDSVVWRTDKKQTPYSPHYSFKKTWHKCKHANIVLAHTMYNLSCAAVVDRLPTRRRIRSAFTVQRGIVITPSICVSLRTQNTDLRTHAVAPPLQDPTDPEEGEKERERWIEPQPCQDGLKKRLFRNAETELPALSTVLLLLALAFILFLSQAIH